MMEPIEIDGSQLEGGGQILRISSSLSAILGLPIKVFKIRAGRSKPGLRPQHLTGLQLTRDVSLGCLKGGNIDSEEIYFNPSSINGGRFMVDIGTAGSVCLLIQSLLPCCLFGKNSSSLKLRGGTNVDMAPPIDYMMEIFKRICSKIGIHFQISLNNRGFFPRGQGEVALQVDPLTEEIPPFNLVEQGKVVSIHGLSFVAGVLPIKVAHIMADIAEKTLRQHFGNSVKINIERKKEDTKKSCEVGSIIMRAETSTGCILGSSSLGQKGFHPEERGRKAAQDLLKEVSGGSCVDSYAQDQLIVFMALANGTSRIRTSNVTLHTETAIHIAQTLTKAKFNIHNDPTHDTVIIECEGIGIKPPNTPPQN